jgi:hypothetical protein
MKTTPKLMARELERLRRRRFRQARGRHVRSEADAAEFIDDLGFLLLMSIGDAPLPNLADANPTERGWSDYHNMTLNARWWWAWKQTLPGARKCYQARLLRARPTFVSWRWFPAFHAVYATGRDYEDAYHAGIMSRAEKRILDLLADRGPLATRALRRAFGPVGKPISREFERALVSLQTSMRICAAGGSLEGWTMYHWALTEDWVPRRLLDRALRLDPQEAMKAIILQHLRNVVAGTPGELAWLFRWEARLVRDLVAELLVARKIEEMETEGNCCFVRADTQ